MSNEKGTNEIALNDRLLRFILFALFGAIPSYSYFADVVQIKLKENWNMMTWRRWYRIWDLFFFSFYF